MTRGHEWRETEQPPAAARGDEDARAEKCVAVAARAGRRQVCGWHLYMCWEPFVDGRSRAHAGRPRARVGGHSRGQRSEVDRFDYFFLLLRLGRFAALSLLALLSAAGSGASALRFWPAAGTAAADGSDG